MKLHTSIFLSVSPSTFLLLVSIITCTLQIAGPAPSPHPPVSCVSVSLPPAAPHFSSLFPMLSCSHPRFFWLTSIDENKFLGGLACWQHSNFFSFQKTVITPACVSLIGELVQLVASFNTNLRNTTLRIMWPTTYKHMESLKIALETRHISLYQLSGDDHIQLAEAIKPSLTFLDIFHILYNLHVFDILSWQPLRSWLL